MKNLESINLRIEKKYGVNINELMDKGIKYSVIVFLDIRYNFDIINKLIAFENEDNNNIKKELKDTIIKSINKMKIESMLLLEEFKELLDIFNIEVRICTHCNKIMTKGYVIEGGVAYYCSDECLISYISLEEWNNQYDDDGDSYYTEWE